MDSESKNVTKWWWNSKHAFGDDTLLVLHRTLPVHYVLGFVGLCVWLAVVIRTHSASFHLLRSTAWWVFMCGAFLFCSVSAAASSFQSGLLVFVRAKFTQRIVWACAAVFGRLCRLFSDQAWHTNMPVLDCDVSAYCLLDKDAEYVQCMWRLSLPCWNPLCGNVEHSCFPVLLLTPAVGISVLSQVPLYEHKQGDMCLGQVHWHTV